ncbi:hypothetical protein ES703_34951 [subsurface metagenome]
MAMNNAVTRASQRISKADARFVLAVVSLGITGVLLVVKIEVPEQWWLIMTMIMVWFFTSRHNDTKAPPP